MKYSKGEISSIFSVLRKYGYKVGNMGSKYPTPTGMVGFPDIVVAGKNIIRFYEVKTKDTNDKFSEAQKEWRKKIEGCICEFDNYKPIDYNIIETSEQAKAEVDNLIIYSMEN